MRTENAIDLFGSHWETELVPPDDAADQLDITNYRVVVVQKLGSGRRRPLVASEVALRTPRYSWPSRTPRSARSL